MSLREDSLLFLLGAGASVDAGIKHAKAMTLDIEEKIRSDSEFKEFYELYNYLKSSIIYQRGLVGAFEDQTATIEELLNVLSEINQKHQNKLYPFIGGWNIHLLKVAGEEFEMVAKLDKLIRSQLFQWINISNYDEASYFRGFRDLVSDIGSAVRVFTLNYDICVEKALVGIDFSIELGFNGDREWEASKFDANENADIVLYLYKLHGSIDWIRDETNGGVLKLCDNPQPNPELIFGNAAKLSSIDPYLFYVHELRKYSLNEALRFIVIVGYSFSDDYVNGLIAQAATRSDYLNVLVVAPIFEDKQNLVSARIEVEKSRIATILNVEKDRIIYENLTAKEFFEEKMVLTYFSNLSGAGDDDPF
ncbi:MAG: SIR2 family protein [Deltaproteobacteria bacterium]|nr:SIR2 family protein [Deltaproteobacteria bacterium]